MKRTKTSKSWMAEHVNDPFVQRAKSEGWRARAAYKLMEIDDKDKLIRPGMIVVDLGAAPGSWSQVTNKRVGEVGRVFALDLLPMEPIPGVEFMQGDFHDEVRRTVRRNSGWSSSGPCNVRHRTQHIGYPQQ